MKKSIFGVLSLFLAVNLLFAQHVPPSFLPENALIRQPQVYNAVLQQNVSLLRTETEQRERFGQPMRIAVGIAADLELNNVTAPLIRMAGGEQIRRQAIFSEGAYGLILTFDELFIPEGGVLFVYTKNREQVEVFTHETNPTGEAFATGILHQNKIVLEYVESTISNEFPRIRVSNIGYVYRSQAALRSDMTCYVNANCSEGDAWQNQARGVVGLSMNLMIPGTNRRDWFVCSGSLVNNVRQDGTPFILTAHHCIDGGDAITFSTMRFDFFKDSDSGPLNCTDQSRTSPHTETMTGATVIADIPLRNASDGTLLKLVNPIPPNWPVFFNGWDATGVTATSGVSIHHPNGMVKKISTFTAPLVSVGNIEFDTDVFTAQNAHWQVRWAPTENGHSVTFGGSSGSPIFNQNGHIVGTLTGGSSFCNTYSSRLAPDFYGKFSWHWNQYSDSTQHFSWFLDPDNTGTLILDGWDPHFEFSNQTPVATEASGITANCFVANWEQLTQARGYFLNVFRRISNNNGEETIVYVIESLDVGNRLSYRVEELDFDTQYFFTVVATDGVELSRASNEVSVTTLCASTLSQVFFYDENLTIFLAVSDTINIYNLTGRRVLTQSVSAGKTPLPVANLPSGVYFVRVGVTVHKIIVR